MAHTGTTDNVPSNYAYLQRRLVSIARTYPAVTYHPDDPNAALIVSISDDMGLTPIPDPQIPPRSVRGCTRPDPATDGAAALEALTGAVVAAGTSPTGAASSPTDSERNRHYAGQLIRHLAATGWTLVRT